MGKWLSVLVSIVGLDRAIWIGDLGWKPKAIGVVFGLETARIGRNRFHIAGDNRHAS